MRIALIAAILASIAFADPEESVVSVAFVSSEGKDSAITGAVVSDDHLLVGFVPYKDVQSCTVTTADGVEHPVTGIVALHPTMTPVLLSVEWQGEAPPTLPVLNRDHLGVERATLMRAGAEPVEASVVHPERISAGALVRPDVFIKPFEWAGCMLVDDQGRLLGVSTTLQIGVSMPVNVKDPVVQTFGFMPGAWLAPLIRGARTRPVLWADVPALLDDRKAASARIEDAGDLDGPHSILRAAKEVLSTSPHHPEALMLKAYASLELERPDDAMRAARDALDYDPGNRKAAIYLAAAALDLDDRTMLREAMRRAIRMSHEDLNDYYFEAYYCFYAGLFDEAREALNRVLAARPDHERALRLQERMNEWFAENPSPEVDR